MVLVELIAAKFLMRKKTRTDSSTLRRKFYLGTLNHYFFRSNNEFGTFFFNAMSFIAAFQRGPKFFFWTRVCQTINGSPQS